MDGWMKRGEEKRTKKMKIKEGNGYKERAERKEQGSEYYEGEENCQEIWKGMRQQRKKGQSGRKKES